MAGGIFSPRVKSWSRGWHANIGIATALTLGVIALSCPFIAHKGGDIAIGKALMQIHYGEFISKQWRWVWIDLQGLALFFLIVSGWLIHHRSVKKAVNKAADDPTAPGSSVAILAGGGPAALAPANELARRLRVKGVRTHVSDLESYNPANLPNERWLLVALAGADGESSLEKAIVGNGPLRLPRLGAAVLAADSIAPVSRIDALSAGLSARGVTMLPKLERNIDDDVPAARAAAWETMLWPHLAVHISPGATPKGKSADAPRVPALAETH